MTAEVITNAPSNQSHTRHPSFLQSAGIMGLATAVSRVLGFARDWLIALFYGTSITTQAFVVAFRIPNLFRDLVGEGAANAAFVPVFTRTLARKGKESWVALAEAIWARWLVGLIVVSTAGVLLAPGIVRVVAPGFRSDPALLSLTIRLTRILVPSIGLVAGMAFFMGLLNSVHHFALPSIGPALLNVCMIAGLFLWRQDAVGLAWGIVVGGALQMAVQVPLLRRLGVKLKPVWKSHPGVGEIRRLLIPRIAGTAVYQGSVLVDTIFASFSQIVGPGGVACLYFANRFLQLPLGLFGVSLAQAALPTLSHHAATGDIQAVRRTCLTALRSTLLVAVPSAVGLAVLGHPIISTLLERGAFSAQSTQATASALTWYALGLASFCVVKVLANVLYAFHDTWTPVRSAALCMVMNLVLNSVLIWPMRLSGLALATSISSIWNSWNLYQAVKKRIGSMGSELKGWLVRVLAASAGMAAVAWGCWAVGSRLVGPSSWQRIIVLLAAVGTGAASFFAMGLLLRIEEMGSLRAWIGRRR